MSAAGPVLNEIGPQIGRRVANPDVFGKRDRQASGLIGPVGLVSYGEWRVATGRERWLSG